MITTLTGSNIFALRKQLRAQVEEFVAENGDFGVEQISGEDTSFDKIMESVQAMPFLAAKRMVILSDPAANKQIAEKLDDLLAAVNEQTDLFIVEPKFDKRSILYKTLKKKTDLKEFTELDERGLVSWLVDLAKEQGGTLSSTDAMFLVQRVGANQLKLGNEVSKLVQYNPIITRATIEVLTQPSPQSTIFSLMDAAFAGNKKKTLQIYHEQRQQKVEPQAILAMIIWQLHVLAIIKTGKDRSVEQIAKEAKINPFVVRKSSSIARGITGAQLKKCIHDVLELDTRLKTEPIDADETLQYLLLSLK